MEKKIRHLRQDVARRIRDVRRTGQLTSLAEEVFQAIPVGLLVCQFQPPGELFCVSANGETGRLTGIDTDKFRGVEFDEIWPDARRQGLTEALLRTVQRGEPLSSYLAYYRKGGVE
ncbi:MAG: hypothetical protein FJY85_02040, partial [Deltaproteobacteria bacterium]|nr:hypothetical protein [Deltaproteobacteria bacterium]